MYKDSSDTLSAIIKATRKGGNMALVGDFFFTMHDFPIGPLMQKALTVRGGQTWPQKVGWVLFSSDWYISAMFSNSSTYVNIHAESSFPCTTRSIKNG
jgi:threonine dehydrogenase-like Zn-dependent dehydrogenase